MPDGASPDLPTSPTSGVASARLWAPRAWLPGGWRDDVLLTLDAGGRWADIAAGVARGAPAAVGASVLAGPLLPGLVNAHSHAFQRAFAGLAERRESASDDFWSWRSRMYEVALRIDPPQLQAVATQLYVELLRGGYTHVCEFHYLQHDRDGRPYAEPHALAEALVAAAETAGIGLTLLPVLYERAGFAEPSLRADQRRFHADVDAVFALRDAFAAGRHGLVDAGLAVHSLRGATAASIHALRRRAAGWPGPIHIHVAEQTAEVDECLARTGARPIEWLAREGLLDARWQLVHATHATRDEIGAVAASGAGIVLCPTTEANLGDGLCDLPGWLDAGVPLAIGSDSHVGRDWREELRWLEYGHRLAARRRNVAAAPEAGAASTAERLFADAVAGGAAAAGQACAGLVAGARADGLVVDTQEAALLGVAPERLLDALVFSGPGAPWRDVLVAGRWVVRGHRHAHGERAANDFAAAMQRLHGTAAGTAGGEAPLAPRAPRAPRAP